MANLITRETATEVTLVATAGQTVFSFDFAIFEASDVIVTVNGEPGQSYTVSGVGDPLGGKVTFASGLTLGSTVKLSRYVPRRRSIDLPSTGPVSMDLIDQEFDRVTAIVQELTNALKNAGSGGGGTGDVTFGAFGELLAATATSSIARAQLELGLIYGRSAVDYGAIPNGAGDQSDAIQAALNVGDKVLLPPGNFNIHKTLRVKTGQTLSGAGKGGIGAVTILTVVGDIIAIEGADKITTTNNGVSIENIAINNSQYQLPKTIGIDLWNMSFCTIRNVALRNHRVAISQNTGKKAGYYNSIYDIEIANSVYGIAGGPGGSIVTAVTKANPGVFTLDTPLVERFALAVGQTVYLNYFVGMTQLNGKTVVIATLTKNAGGKTYSATFTENGSALDTTAYSTYTSGGFVSPRVDAGGGGGNALRLVGGRIASTTHGIQWIGCLGADVSVTFEYCMSGLWLAGGKASNNLFVLYAEKCGVHQITDPNDATKLIWVDTNIAPSGAVWIEEDCDDNEVYGSFSNASDRIVDLNRNNRACHGMGVGYNGYRPSSGALNRHWNETLSIDTDANGFADCVAIASGGLPAGMVPSVSAAGQRIRIENAASQRNITFGEVDGTFGYRTQVGKTYTFAMLASITRPTATDANGVPHAPVWLFRGSKVGAGGNDMASFPLSLLGAESAIMFSFVATGTVFYPGIYNNIASPNEVVDLDIGGMWFGEGLGAPAFGDSVEQELYATELRIRGRKVIGSDGRYLPPAPTVLTGTAHTGELAHANGYLQFNNAAATTFTVPANATVAYPVGTVIEVEQLGAGALTIAAAAGVTINSRGADLSLAGQFSVAMLKKTGTDTWTLTGDM